MIRLIISKSIPDYTNYQDPVVRKQYGVLGGVLGILCNSLLFLCKLIAGILLGSIAVISDAFNNLSDMAASVISLIGAKLSSRRPDSGHPYGHGRAEYISALILAFIIIFVGIQLLKSSVDKIFHPASAGMNWISLGLLLLSIPIKLWMWSYNRYMGNVIDSSMLRAAAKDSLSDIAATSAVIISAVLAPIVPFPIDGVMGLVVSLLILWTGYQVAKDTIDRLMGQKPEEALRAQLETAVLENPNVLGMHDLMVHDYGPGQIIASVHAEVPETLSLVECHEMIDCIEKKILTDLNVNIVIHMDPVSLKNED